jgi:ATP-binding cassette subfamily F protein 3
LRNLLGCFLFGGDEVEKKIKVLSGGEKARVALAKTIVSKANFLLLDEPTNHLDIHSVELLIEALKRYQGTLILVSHDRYFISKVANKIWEIEDLKIKEFAGGYDELVEWKKRIEEGKSLQSNEAKSAASHGLKGQGKKDKPTHAEKNRNTSSEAINRQAAMNSELSQLTKELQKSQKQFQQLEEKISMATDKKKELGSALADPATYADKNKFLKAESDYKSAEDELYKLNSQYEQLFEKIMNLEEKLK